MEEVMPNYIQNIDPYLLNQIKSSQQTMNCNLVYPEIYYKVQPFVMFACDQLQSGGNTICQAALDQVGESIYTNVCIMNPDLEEYASTYPTQAQTQSVSATQRNGGLFRRRGVFQDFIDILLLNELLRRGTYVY